jgi:hypothetical protein
MRKIGYLIAAAVLLFPLVARAQQETVDVGDDVRGRLSVEVDKKLARGLHVFAEGELRAYDNFSTFKRYAGTFQLTERGEQTMDGASVDGRNLTFNAIADANGVTMHEHTAFIS